MSFTRPVIICGITEEKRLYGVAETNLVDETSLPQKFKVLDSF